MRQRDAADFAAYVGARWTPLVESLRAEGLAPEAAERAVARALVASRRGWGGLLRDGDVEVLVWEAVRQEAGLPPTPGAVAPLVAHPAEVVPDPMVAAAPSRDPLDVVDREARRRRRRTLRLVGLTAVLLVLVGTSAAWWAGRPPAPHVAEEVNPVPVPWYADGRLHLAEVVVTLPGVTALAPEADGDVVVRRTGGTFWRVEADGDVGRLAGEPAALARERPAPTVSEGLELGFADRVVDGVAGPDGLVVHLLDNAVAGASYGTYLRLSGTGRQALVVCREGGTACDAPRLVTTSGERVLLR